MVPTSQVLRSQVPVKSQGPGLELEIPRSSWKVKIAPLDPIQSAYQSTTGHCCIRTFLIPTLDRSSDGVENDGEVQGPWMLPTMSHFLA